MKSFPIANSVLFLWLLMPVFSASADFFQYTDKQGTLVVVDDEGKIPKAYQNQIKKTRVDKPERVKYTGVRVENNRVYVPVRLSYGGKESEAWMLLDTGASVTTISTELADRLGIKPKDTKTSAARLADGGYIQTFTIRLDNISVGPKKKHNIAVGITPTKGPRLPFDGLLGMNFLGDFKYHLDVNEQMLNWLE